MTPAELETLITKARELAFRVHQGQFRFDKVTPYITHPEAVANACADEDKPVAWLHDCIEDADVPEEIARVIWADFPAWVYYAVRAMTKTEGEDYTQYIARIADNEVACRVKIQDIKHNLDGQCSEKRKQKYANALEVLEAAMTRKDLPPELEYHLRNKSKDLLLAARAYIDKLLSLNRPDPKFEGGVTLWNKIWKRRVRAIYGESEENYAVVVFWHNVRNEWTYRDKYSGEDMFESDLEEYNDQKEKPE